MNNQIIRAIPTADNPDGIVFVPESVAIDVGQGANFGGGGAAGTTVAGPVASFIIKNGKVPLPFAGGQFSFRFSSSAAANRAGNYILLETRGATQENPYFLKFEQIILRPFTGPGEFYLDERDASDIPGGESTVTVATKDGFSAGYTFDIVKAITSDKIYRISFIPGTTGDGIYSINIFTGPNFGPGGGQPWHKRH